MAKSPFSETQFKALEDLGLTRAQALLYLTALKHGISSVLELSKLTKINRQRIYEEAEKLKDIGLFEITRRDRRKYIPASPRKLAVITRRKIEELQNKEVELSIIIPSLENLVLPSKNKVVVKYYEGLEQIREAYSNELEFSKNGEGLSFSGSLEDAFKFFPESYWHKWNSEFAKHDSKARILVHNSVSAEKFARDDKKYKRETRYLDNFPLKTNIDVFKNVVLIISYYDELAIWIESHMLAQSYRLLFESLWSSAKQFK
ncbi:MAG TPA: helix-turn-helix domain-containing protein [Candidatus Paceibacterota bacterium]